MALPYTHLVFVKKDEIQPFLTNGMLDLTKVHPVPPLSLAEVFLPEDILSKNYQELCLKVWGTPNRFHPARVVTPSVKKAFRPYSVGENLIYIQIDLEVIMSPLYGDLCRALKSPPRLCVMMPSPDKPSEHLLVGSIWPASDCPDYLKMRQEDTSLKTHEYTEVLVEHAK